MQLFEIMTSKRKQLSVWMRKGYGNPGKISF